MTFLKSTFNRYPKGVSLWDQSGEVQKLHRQLQEQWARVTRAFALGPKGIETLNEEKELFDALDAEWAEKFGSVWGSF